MANEPTQEEFLGDLKGDANTDPFNGTQEQEDPFAREEETGTEKEAVEPVEDKPLPFHKDPKIQRFIERELEKKLAGRIPEQQEEAQDDYFDDVVKAFTDIVGNDTPQKVQALDALKNSLTTLEQRTLERAIERQESQRQEEVALEQEYDNKVADVFEEIEDKYKMDLYAPQNKKLRIQFINFWEKVSPKEDGEISDLADGVEAFDAFRQMYKSQSQATRGKELASRSMERSGGEVTAPKETPRLNFDNVGDYIRERLGM